MANLTLNDNDGSSGASDQDTLAPLPLPGATPWPLLHSFPYQPYPHPYSSPLIRFSIPLAPTPKNCQRRSQPPHLNYQNPLPRHRKLLRII